MGNPWIMRSDSSSSSSSSTRPSSPATDHNHSSSAFERHLATMGTRGVQSQLVCSGCQKLLLYPHGGIAVRCAVCNTVTNALLPGTEMAQLVCGGCHTLLMYIRGATSVKCSCCRTINLALEGSANVRVGLAHQQVPFNVPHCIARFLKEWNVGPKRTVQDQRSRGLEVAGQQSQTSGVIVIQTKTLRRRIHMVFGIELHIIQIQMVGAVRIQRIYRHRSL